MRVRFGAAANGALVRVRFGAALTLALAAGASVAVGLSGCGASAVTQTGPLSRAQYLTLAEQGVAKISMWWDPSLHWYLSYLGDHQARPLGSIWDTVSTFELLDEVALAQPTARNRAAVRAFGDYYERYWDPNLKPAPGYAPYPGDSGANQTTWYDDAGWLGQAFLDGDLATGTDRYLADAERAMRFIEAGGWDAPQGGGMWWDTAHPWRSGEALAADADLAARLYQATGDSRYLGLATSWIAWANRHLLQQHGVYLRTSDTPYGSETYTGPIKTPNAGNRQSAQLPPQCAKAASPHSCLLRLCKTHKGPCPTTGGTPFSGSGTKISKSHGHSSGAQQSTARPAFVAMPNDGEGTMVSAMVTLYQTTHRHSWLTEAERLAGNIITWLEPFDDGPQYDGVMLRGFVALYAQDHQARWYRFVTSMASVIIRTARTAPGVYLKPWGGGGSRIPSAVPGMLRTDASSLMVFADLATVPAPK